MADYDDEKHKRDEAERRERRKVSKTQKSEAQLEKERKRKEHAAKILGQHGGDSKKRKTEKAEDKSTFQELFAQRAQGFQIDFKFRNAPPRPPVGPCFVGHGLDGVLLDLAQYKPLNAVEINHTWKLHSEPDLGVPLAPSAMDPRSYTPSLTKPELHPEDLNLLDWKGSMGDTAAEELKKRRDHARATARLALMGKNPAQILKSKASVSSTSATTSGRKAFSRVLDMTMQSWMKKTTYLSNDYSRKVHDFKSLAKTKEELVQDLAVREKQFSQRRTAVAITQSFEDAKNLSISKHPTRNNVTPVVEMSFLPNAELWGNAYTHVVIDKTPGESAEALSRAFVANVQKRDANARMTCQLFVPGEKDIYQAIQQYDLDVVPLKEEDAPHFNFCIFVDKANKMASYVPISSRVQLSTGRPLRKKSYNMKIERRSMTDTEKLELDQRVAEIDADLAKNFMADSGKKGNIMDVDSDDDSDRGESFVNTNQTIVAEG